MSKDKTKSEKNPLKKKFSQKQGSIIIDIALILLGIVITIWHEGAGNVISVVIGVLLCSFGIFRFVAYFAKTSEEAVGSFGIVQGTVLLGLGVLFIIPFPAFRALLKIIYAIILIVSGVTKLQYSVDLMRLKSKMWWVSFLGALVTIGLGIMIIVLLDKVAWIMIFTGISFIVNGIWDLIVVLLLDKEKSLQEERSKGMMVEYKVENTEE